MIERGLDGVRAHPLSLLSVSASSAYAKIADHIAGLRENEPLNDPDTVFVVDISGVGRAVGSMLKERGLHFEPVTWTGGDSFKRASDGWTADKQYLMSHLGAALSSSRLQIIESLRDGAELKNSFRTIRSSSRRQEI